MVGAQVSTFDGADNAVLEAQLFHNMQPVTVKIQFVLDLRPAVSIPMQVNLPARHPWPNYALIRLAITRLKHAEIAPGWHLIRAALDVNNDYLGELPGQIYVGIPQPVPSAVIPFLWPAAEPAAPASMVTLALRHIRHG